MKFQVRDGFVATVFNKIETSEGRFENRQQDSYAGEVVDYTAEQAELNRHKLEPKDKAAVEYLESKHAKAEQPVSPASVAEQVNAAVADALVSFKSGLLAAGVLKEPAKT